MNIIPTLKISTLHGQHFFPPHNIIEYVSLQVKFLEFIYCLCYHDDTVQAICCSDKGKVFSTGCVNSTSQTIAL